MARKGKAHELRIEIEMEALRLQEWIEDYLQPDRDDEGLEIEVSPKDRAEHIVDLVLRSEIARSDARRWYLASLAQQAQGEN